MYMHLRCTNWSNHHNYWLQISENNLLTLNEKIQQVHAWNPGLTPPFWYLCTHFGTSGIWMGLVFKGQDMLLEHINTHMNTACFGTRVRRKHAPWDDLCSMSSERLLKSLLRGSSSPEEMPFNRKSFGLPPKRRQYLLCGVLLSTSTSSRHVST